MGQNLNKLIDISVKSVWSAEDVARVHALMPAAFDEVRAEGYQQGYTEAVTDYGIWKDGQQTIGCLETPVKEVLKKKFP